MSAYKNQANKRPTPQKETLNVAATDAKLKTAKPAPGMSNSPKIGATIYVTKSSE